MKRGIEMNNRIRPLNYYQLRRLGNEIIRIFQALGTIDTRTATELKVETNLNPSGALSKITSVINQAKSERGM